MVEQKTELEIGGTSVKEEIFPHLQIMRYAGNKAKLLSFVIPPIIKETKQNSIVIDLFAGTQSVGYAIKKSRIVYSNDVQMYSWIIGKAIIESHPILSAEQAKSILLPSMKKNQKTNADNLFQNSFAGTYFGKKQCEEIDDIHFAIENSTISDEDRYGYYCALMYAMSKCAATTGHFAEYLEPKESRHLRMLSISKIFFQRCNDIQITPGIGENHCFNEDFKEFISGKMQSELNNCDLVYADPPYSNAQYSRYYHVLETLVQYDYPKLKHKGRYRPDRFVSKFGYKSKVADEFEQLFSGVAAAQKPLILSYVNSGSGLLPEKELKEIAETYYRKTKIIRQNHTHSKLGNGKPSRVEEFLLIAKN